MSDTDKLLNILSFLGILFGENVDVMEAVKDLGPEYIIEKYERYVNSDRREWPWGMHPSIKRGDFLSYLQKHNVPQSDDKAENW